VIIHINLEADPQDIARALQRELGSELCRRVGLALAEERVVLVDIILPPDGDRP
jgi:hypothetical protein